MQITNLKIKNYRNYTEESIKFIKGLNVLTGQNASGKTNLLESIYLMSIGKSPRVSYDKDLINWEKDFFYTCAKIEKTYTNTKVEFYLDRKSSKRIAINGMSIRKIGELMGALNIVYFSPDELKMIKDSPKERRRFVNISLSQQNKTYFYNLQKYNKILKQRNKLLKSTYTFQNLHQTIKIWDMQLAQVGAKIIYERRKFLLEIKELAEKTHKRLTDNKEILKIDYECEFLDDDINEIYKKFLEGLDSNLERDYRIKFTIKGPHRDDFSILINDIDVRKFGSQGQQRSSALSLKLAEIEQIYNQNQEYPILLLDDVLSELDKNRQKQLIEETKNIQTILTCTEFNFEEDENTKIFKIENGQIIK